MWIKKVVFLPGGWKTGIGFPSLKGMWIKKDLMPLRKKQSLRVSVPERDVDKKSIVAFLADKYLLDHVSVPERDVDKKSVMALHYMRMLK